MKNLMAKTCGLLFTGIVVAGMAAPAALADVYKVTSIAPGTSPFVVNTAIAKVVNRTVDNVEFQVRATGAATKHMVDAAMGEVDFFFGSNTINFLMVNQIGPYAKFTNGPELESKLGMIFAYEIGPYHYITRADSGIKTLNDLRGKKVFAGPPGGAATRVVLGNLKAMVGIEADEMDVQRFGFDAAIQAFQDDKIDVIVLSTNVPSPSVQQFALTKKIRILDVDIDKLPDRRLMGGSVVTIPADAYGENQVNTKDTRSHGAIVNFSAGMHVDEEVVYQVTKAIWENLEEIHGTAQWMPGVLQKERALELIAGRLHPGAERYYREMGWKIPEPVVFKPKK